MSEVSRQGVHPAQLHFMYVYGREKLGLGDKEIDDLCLARFQTSPDQLTAVQAYRFIEQLQGKDDPDKPVNPDPAIS